MNLDELVVHTKVNRFQQNNFTRKRMRGEETPLSERGKAIQTARQIFLSSGCCILPDVLPIAFVEDCHKQATEDLESLQETMRQTKSKAIATSNVHLLTATQRVDFAEMIARDGNRLDVRYNLDSLVPTELIHHPVVYPLMRELLGSNVILLYAGVMWAMKSEESQKWHADGGHLFAEDDHHSPPHCINVFYPLVDLSKENGATQVQLGTHRRDCDKESVVTLPLQVDAGGAILFDYRLQHSGGCNTTDTPRPILYLCYARDFFRDTRNTRSLRQLDPHTPTWMPKTLQPEAVDSMAILKVGKRDSNNSKAMANIPASSGERWVLFHLSIELEDRVEKLVVHHGDSATEIAAAFCRKHEMDQSCIEALASTIQQQIDDATKR